MSQLHADGVFLLVGLTIGCVAVARVSGASPAAVRSAVVLLLVELAQGTVGVVQYLTDLPEVLVAAHLLGAALVMAAATDLLLRGRSPVRVPSAGEQLAARP